MVPYFRHKNGRKETEKERKREEETGRKKRTES
jgi:hypothetical protein